MHIKIYERVAYTITLCTFYITLDFLVIFIFASGLTGTNKLAFDMFIWEKENCGLEFVQPSGAEAKERRPVFLPYLWRTYKWTTCQFEVQLRLFHTSVNKLLQTKIVVTRWVFYGSCRSVHEDQRLREFSDYPNANVLETIAKMWATSNYKRQISML